MSRFESGAVGGIIYCLIFVTAAYVCSLFECFLLLPVVFKLSMTLLVLTLECTVFCLRVDVEG